MEWAKAVREAVRYMEDHMTEDITMNEVARHVNISPFYFNKGFSILCGYSITEYIRNRRMALAGNELVTSDITVMELAINLNDFGETLMYVFIATLSSEHPGFTEVGVVKS